MPAWHIRNRGYIHHDGSWGPPRKNNYAFVWPNDAQRSWLGRLSDIATNKGPDIYITSNANRKPTAADGPSRRRWTGYPGYEDDPDIESNDLNSFLGNFPFTGYTRNRKQYYDHHKRRFRRSPHNGMWTDVERYPGRPNYATAVEQWPFMGRWNQINHPWGGTQNMDPRNTARANGVGYGAGGNGGYWDPVNDGWPGNEW